MNVRSLLINLINDMGLHEVGVEVGVQKGHFSRRLLRETGLSRLFSVDSWRSKRKEEYMDYANVPQWKHEVFHLQTRFNLLSFGWRSKVMRLSSQDAAKRFKLDSFCFAFIDADHSYESVKQDLQDWFPLVRGGGLLCGDDYLDGEFFYGKFGVKQAVDEFAEANGLELNVFRDIYGNRLWTTEVP